MFRQINFAIIGVLLVGCATEPAANTPSGHPEVTLVGVRADCVRSAWLNFLVNDGYSIQKTSDTQIVAGRRTDNFALTLLLGTELSGAPEERVTVLFIPQGAPDSLRVVVSIAYVSNQGTAFENIQPGRETQTDQEYLMSIKTGMENKCRS